MEARYTTHRLIDEFQREKMLETQANQEQVLPVPQEVKSKPTELKTVDQLKATDRPADVEQKLRERGQQLLDKLMDTCAGIKRLPKAMRGDTSQLIKAMFSSLRTTDLWMRDVTATATQIVEKFNELQQDQITQRTR